MTASLVLTLLAAAPIPLEPAGLTFGAAEAAFELAVPEASLAVSVTPANGVGTVARVDRRTPARVRVQYRLPAEHFPQVAIFAIELLGPGGQRSLRWATLALAAEATLKLETKPLATVTVTIGPRAFGPVPADAHGKLALPVQVPPGFSHAEVSALDRAGNRTTTPLDLAVRPFPRVGGSFAAGFATPDGPAELELFAIEADGRPLGAGATPEVTARIGSCEAAAALGEGAFAVRYRAPGEVSSGRDTVSARMGGGPPITLEVPLRPGKASRLVLAFARARYVAGQAAPVPVEVHATDAHGNPTPAAAPKLSTDFGSLSGSEGSIQLTVPDRFAGRTELKVRATVDGLTGEATLALSPGAPATAELSMPSSAEAGSAVAGTLTVRDGFGNPVTAPESDLEVRVGDGPPAHLAPGAERDWGIRAEVPSTSSPGQLDVSVRTADRALTQTQVMLLPYQRPWAVIVAAQLAGTWNFVRAAAFSPRLWLGVRLGRSPFELGAEGAFAWYPRQDAVPTLDGRNDAQVELSAWSVALSVRGSLPLAARVSLFAALSAGTQYTTTVLSAPASAEQTDRSWGVLFRGAAGVSVYLVGGRLLAQVEFTASPANPASPVRGNLGGLGFGLGYAFAF